MKTKRISEANAKGVKGFLLYSPLIPGYFFRIYNKDNPIEFEDYKITAEDIEIELQSNFNALVKYSDGSQRLDYTQSVLGGK
jgi:hypothetical protein